MCGRKQVGIAVGVVAALAVATLGVASLGGEPGREGGDIQGIERTDIPLGSRGELRARALPA